MPLLSKDSVREMLADEVYASSDLSVALAKYKFPKTESNRETF
jgi:glutamate decarboxylase